MVSRKRRVSLLVDRKHSYTLGELEGFGPMSSSSNGTSSSYNNGMKGKVKTHGSMCNFPINKKKKKKNMGPK